jgi:GNAT superfamily N-acetyltransferase
METVTVAERPDLADRAWERTRDVLPEYNMHGDVLNSYWGRLTEEQPEFQFHLVGDGDEILARARSIPVRWDGRIEDLPPGIDGAIARGFDEGGANVLCALVIMVPRDLQRRGLSALAVRAMLELARRHGLTALIAPVRPSWKEHYPLVPIERYAAWRRADGLFFDPWMRVHERLGAIVLKPEPQSLRITGTVAEWDEWTGMAFPESADY